MTFIQPKPRDPELEAALMDYLRRGGIIRRMRPSLAPVCVPTVGAMVQPKPLVHAMATIAATCATGPVIP